MFDLYESHDAFGAATNYLQARKSERLVFRDEANRLFGGAFGDAFGDAFCCTTVVGPVGPVGIVIDGPSAPAPASTASSEPPELSEPPEPPAGEAVDPLPAPVRPSATTTAACVLIAGHVHISR